MMPACRMAPPICCLSRQASAMNSREPARAAPTGAPRPLVKSIQAESDGAAQSRAAVPPHLLAGPAVHARRDLVAHGAGGKEAGGLLAEEIGHHLLQRGEGGVLVLLLVAPLRLAHEPPHLRRGAGDRVAGEIDLDLG